MARRINSFSAGGAAVERLGVVGALGFCGIDCDICTGAMVGCVGAIEGIGEYAARIGAIVGCSDGIGAIVGCHGIIGAIMGCSDGIGAIGALDISKSSNKLADLIVACTVVATRSSKLGGAGGPEDFLLSFSFRAGRESFINAKKSKRDDLSFSKLTYEESFTMVTTKPQNT